MQETTRRCADCGDFQVNHFSNYLDETFNAWIHDRLQTLRRSHSFARFSDAVHASDIRLAPHLIHVIHMLSGAKTSSDPASASTQRAHAIWSEALRRGMRMEQLIFFGVPLDFYRYFSNGRWIYFKSLPVPSGSEAHAYEWSDDKWLFKQLLQENRIPTAESFFATNIDAAQMFFDKLSAPVAVKPRIGSNSRHTTTMVYTAAQLREAFASAQKLCRYVLVEEHISGAVCRATVVDDALVGFLASRQPYVTGDGVSTISQLIAEKNGHRPPRVGEVVLNTENESYLARQGYTADSLLQGGVTVPVSWRAGMLSGGENREMLADVHPKLRACVERVAQLLKAPIVGFDLIIEDPTKDPDEQRWGILEANTVPFIEIHSDPLYGEPSNVAAAVWNLWDKTKKT